MSPAKWVYCDRTSVKGGMLKKSPQDLSNHTPKSCCNNTLHYFITVEGFVSFVFILSVSFLFCQFHFHFLISHLFMIIALHHVSVSVYKSIYGAWSKSMGVDKHNITDPWTMLKDVTLGHEMKSEIWDIIDLGSFLIRLGHGMSQDLFCFLLIWGYGLSSHWILINLSFLLSPNQEHLWKNTLRLS